MKLTTHVLLPDATLDELTAGYTFDGTQYTCLACGAVFEKGQIYPYKDVWYDAQKRIEAHLRDEHGSAFDFLIGLDKEYTDLTAQQRTALALFYRGEPDAVVAKALRVEPSTVRNYRFILRKKERQAKILLALMQMYDRRKSADTEISAAFPVSTAQTSQTAQASQTPQTSPGVPEAASGAICLPGGFTMEPAEFDKLRKAIFTSDGRLKYLPSKRKQLMLVLTELIKRFDASLRYTEMEVNEIVSGAYADYATLRRELIDYKLLARKSDCSEYWVNQQ